MPVKKTPAQYVLDVATIHADAITVLEEYVRATVKIKHKCTKCKNIWATTPSSIMHGNGCPKCAKLKMAEARRHTTDTFKLRLRSIYDTKIQLLGEYRQGRALRFKCFTCLNTFKHKSILERKIGCPRCATAVKQKNSSKYAWKNVITDEGESLRLQGFEPQALNWILNKFPKLKASDIVFDSSGNVPSVRYFVGKRSHWYYPDMYIPKQNRIIEVKSIYTIGLDSGRNWGKTQAKAKACKEAGYKFVLLLMTKQGERLWLPKQWYLKTRKQVTIEMAFHNGVSTEEQYNDFRQQKEKEDSSKTRRRRTRRPSKRTRRRRAA